MVKVAVNNDLVHYSHITKNSIAYKKIKKVTIFIGIMFLLVMCIDIISFSMSRTIKSLTIACTAFIFACFFLFLVIMIKSAPKRTYKRFNAANPNLAGEILFDENAVNINSRSDKASRQLNVPYSRIESVEESEGYVLIKIENSGYVNFNENDMLEGSMNDAKELLCSKVGSKYKIK